MPIGYANFSTIEQANNQTVNQLVGLGQQIGNAIETHAATQSAQAMLPMIQQQYANGMGKIALGDQSGMSDVIQAASIANQNPITAGYGKNMIAGMQQVSEMSRAKAIADARLQAVRERGDYAAALSAQNYGQRLDLQNTKQTSPKDMMSAQKTGVQLQNTYQSAMDQAEKDGDPQAYQAAAMGLANLNAQSTQTGLAPTGQPLTFEARKQAMALGQQLNDEMAKSPEGLNPKTWFNHQSTKKISDLTDQITKLHNNPDNLLKLPQTSQLPSAQSNADISQQTGNTSAYKSPEDIKNAFQSGKLNQDQALQLLQAFPTK